MGRLRILSGRQICTILTKHGFTKVRQKGSHLVMQKPLPAERSTVTVPVPDHREVRIGTLLSIIRQSGIARSEFES